MSEVGEYEETVKPEEDIGDTGDEEEEEKEEEEEEGEHEDKEMLFLIEFFVDTLFINTKTLYSRNIDPCVLDGQTCVVLTFLNFPPMTICEKDWGPENEETTDEMIKFNAGKSLMFALSDSQFGNPPPIYLDVTAHKMMPHGSPEASISIGKTKICLTELFKQVFDKVDENPDKLPLSKSIKDSYQLAGTSPKKPAGEIVIYIRLSCLGQNVVTEFQRGGDECGPFLFKNKESDKVYECNAKDDSLEECAGSTCPPCPAWGDSEKRTKSCFGEPPPSGNVEEDELEYDEFGTEVHGHALTIKIQKSRKDVEDENTDFSGKSGKSGPGNRISFEVPRDQTLCRGGKNQTTVLNLKGCGGDDGIQAAEGETEDKDVFVLRIGKKGEVNGKGKLELELKTPKQKLDRTPKGPQMISRAAQTDREEAPKKGKKRK